MAPNCMFLFIYIEVESFSEQDCITKAVQEASEWFRAQNTPELNRNPIPQQQKYRYSPKQEFTTVQTDGAWDNQSKEAGLGLIVRSSSRNLSDQVSKKTYSVCSPLMAEALALELGIRTALNLSIDKLQMCSDSLSLIRILHSDDSCRRLHGIVSDIRSLASLFKAVEFSWIPRSENDIADALAKRALSSPLCFNLSLPLYADNV